MISLRKWIGLILLASVLAQTRLNDSMWEPVPTAGVYVKPVRIFRGTANGGSVTILFDRTKRSHLYSAASGVYTDIPVLDSRQCTERHYQFNAQIEWHENDDQFSEIGPGLWTRFTFGNEHANRSEPSGLHAAFSGGMNPDWVLHENVDFPYPRAAVGVSDANTNICFSKATSSGACVFQELVNSTILRYGVWNATIDMLYERDTSSLKINRFRVWFASGAGTSLQWEKLIDLQPNDKSTMVAPVWGGELENGILWLETHRADVTMRHYDLTFTDVCNESADTTTLGTTIGTTRAGDTSTHVSQMSQVSAPQTDTNSSPPPPVLEPTTIDLSLATAGVQPTKTSTTTTESTNDSYEQKMDTRQHNTAPANMSIFIVIAAFGCLFLCLLTVLMFYLFRKRIRRSENFTKMYHNVPGMHALFCCWSDKIARDNSDSESGKSSVSKPSSSSGSSGARAIDNNNEFTSARAGPPLYVEQLVAQDKANGNQFSEYGPLPSMDNGQPYQIPHDEMKHAGIPKTHRPSANERRRNQARRYRKTNTKLGDAMATVISSKVHENEKNRANRSPDYQQLQLKLPNQRNVNNGPQQQQQNQYDRVERVAVIYDSMLADRPDTPPNQYDKVELVEIADVSTEGDTSAPDNPRNFPNSPRNQYEKANAPFYV